MEPKSLAAALAFLRSRNRQRSTKYVENDLPKVLLPSGNLAGKGRPPLLGMKEWLQRLGHTEAELDSLNIIHIAGTKGKGSTCAFIESFLRAHGKAVHFPRKTGLYTSPHLVSELERIRIDFEPLPEALFAKYIFEVRDALGLNSVREGPGYLQLLALVSFHAFLQEGVEVAIYETHHGGEYCATNVIPTPVVTAVTTIGRDHIVDLGPSIENIAWHKAGIFKRGASAFTIRQEPKVSAVLHHRATEKGVVLRTVPADPQLSTQFDSSVQQLNCSLARAVADEFLQKAAPTGRPQYLSSDEIKEGLRRFRWPGRFETIQEDDCTWFLDVAHNEISILEASGWFQRASLERSTKHVARVLMFAQSPTTKRNTNSILQRLAESLQVPLQSIIFTTDKNQVESSDNDRKLLEHYSQLWTSFRPQDANKTYMAATINQAVGLAREKVTTGYDTHVLVTGSFSLVGGVLSLGNWVLNS